MSSLFVTKLILLFNTLMSVKLTAAKDGGNVRWDMNSFQMTLRSRSI